MSRRSHQRHPRRTLVDLGGDSSSTDPRAHPLLPNRNYFQQGGGTVGAATTGDIFIFADNDGNGGSLGTANATSTIGSSSAGDVTLQSASIALLSSVTAGGDLTIQPSSASDNVVVANPSVDFSPTTNEVDFLEAASITIGRADGTGVLTVNAHVFDDPRPSECRERAAVSRLWGP